MQRLCPHRQEVEEPAREDNQALESRGGREEWARDKKYSKTQAREPDS